jgi:hypothetical protein
MERLHFCLELQQKVSLDEGFLEKIIFSIEATFHISGKVNRHNVRVWGSENRHAYVEHVRDSPKVNVFCAIGFFALDFRVDVCRVTNGAHIEHL